MKKYAIINKETKEFYPDPTYTDPEKAREKIAYMQALSRRADTYEIEELTPEREEQHDKALMKFWSYMD